MTIAHGFTYEIIHGEDFDPGCGVCTQMTDVVNKILGEWLEDAIFIQLEQFDDFEDKKRLVILQPSNDPIIKRIGDWFVENFEETIKLASIDKIMFRECDTEIVYEFIITY